jgi:NAD(P)-dependent dehydrogenase (short-subunit alcohol dehydrogenase family)
MTLVLAARTTQGRPSKLPGTLEETAAQCREAGAEVLLQPADMTIDEDLEALMSATLERFGRIDVAVNNAAISFREKFIETPMKIWDRAFRVNVHAPAYLSQLVVPALIEQGGGSIVNVSSVAAVNFSVPWLSYSASKAALEAFTLGLANELRDEHVAVNAIRIEVAVRTEGYVAVRPREDYSGYEDPEIIGEAVAWLLRRGADHTGNIHTVAELRTLGAITTPQPAVRGD